jgi:hypothetical protein
VKDCVLHVEVEKKTSVTNADHQAGYVHPKSNRLFISFTIQINPLS